MINNENLLCIVGYYSKFPVMKKVESLSTKDLIQAAKFIFAKLGLNKKLVSDEVTNFLSEQFKDFCWHLSTDQAVTFSYHHQSNGQVQACITFVKHTKKCRQTNNNVHFALLQIRSTPVSAGLPSPAKMLFNKPIRALFILFIYIQLDIAQYLQCFYCTLHKFTPFKIYKYSLLIT